MSKYEPVEASISSTHLFTYFKYKLLTQSENILSLREILSEHSMEISIFKYCGVFKNRHVRILESDVEIS